MTDMSRDVVQIGVGPSRITRVTPKCVKYVDAAGQEQAMDLSECVWKRDPAGATNLSVASPNASSEKIAIAQWYARCIGSRGLSGNPVCGKYLWRPSWEVCRI
jgi:hypothetical protein